MKRKELEVGKEYFSSSRPLEEYSYWTSSTSQKVRVEDVEYAWEYRSYHQNPSTDLADFYKTSKGQGVLVSFEDIYRGVSTRKFRVVPSRYIRAPYEQAKQEIKARRWEKARQEKHYEDVVKPALNSLTSALNTLAVQVTEKASHIHPDTPLRHLPLDVIEALTLIVRESNQQKVSA